jgi:hypothetical protein
MEVRNLGVQVKIPKRIIWLKHLNSESSVGKTRRRKLSMSRISVLIAVMTVCVILVPVIAYLFGGWFAYWGHALLAIIFSVVVVLIRTRYYWEED